MERRSRFFVLAPLLVLGSIVAHAVAYAVAQPDGRARGALLARTGHAWLSWTPAILGTAALALVVGLGLSVLAAAAGSETRRTHPLLAGVPFVGFTVQETVERSLSGGLTQSTYGERFFLVGLTLEAVLGLVCLLVARLLVEGAEELGRLLVRRRPPAHAPSAPLGLHAVCVHVVRPDPLAARVAGRAPPRRAS